MSGKKKKTKSVSDNTAKIAQLAKKKNYRQIAKYAAGGMKEAVEFINNRHGAKKPKETEMERAV
jgi:hypothetical protein